MIDSQRHLITPEVGLDVIFTFFSHGLHLVFEDFRTKGLEHVLVFFIVPTLRAFKFVKGCGLHEGRHTEISDARLLSAKELFLS
mgnify:CR=1 FL=1